MNILKKRLFFITVYESIFILFKNYLDSAEDYDYVYGGGRSKFPWDCIIYSPEIRFPLVLMVCKNAVLMLLNVIWRRVISIWRISCCGCGWVCRMEYNVIFSVEFQYKSYFNLLTNIWKNFLNELSMYDHSASIK